MTTDFDITMQMFQGIPEGIMIQDDDDETLGDEQGDGAVEEGGTSSIRIDVQGGRVLTSIANINPADCVTLLLCLSKIELELLRKMRGA
ncbi:hypothetical protein [Burkholderia territorii]|uniref:hypothetical protein n=1 Tax=Burkholderia territorii TaxID=1503055 RepID=UPI0007B8BA15|nr:hypothetical protein [Burkholderia territorii]